EAQQHFGGLWLAVVRALAQVKSRLVRVDPRAVGVVGNQVCLTRQSWDPETVVRIGSQQLAESWLWMPGVAHRCVQFICGHHSKRRITVLPPKLMADGDNFDGIG